MTLLRTRGCLALILLSFIFHADPFVRPALAETENTAEAIIEKRKCRRCHTILGEGGAVGPDLSVVGTRRDAEFIKKKLLHPKSLQPQSPMPPFRGTESELETLVAYLSSLK